MIFDFLKNKKVNISYSNASDAKPSLTIYGDIVKDIRDCCSDF